MPGSPFPPTRWSVLRALQGPSQEEAERGLVYLCESYWYPVYAFVRGQGHDRAAAEDLTQGFFTSLIAKEHFENVSPERGRFRTFLLAAAKHFLANERDRHRTQKRGRGVASLSLDFAEADLRYQETPASLYEQHWARMLLNKAVRRLHGEYVKAGKAVPFEACRPYLTDDDPPAYAKTAAKLEVSEGALKVKVHRMRQRLGEILRSLIEETVATPEETDEELRCVLELLQRR